MYKSIVIVAVIVMFCSCATSNKNYNPAKKFSKTTLQKDYSVLVNILQAKHPSLYWYTPKPAMDAYFNKFYKDIKDSMTEQDFAWHVLAPLIDKIHCGHTSVSLSKKYSKWATNKSIPAFPLFLKVWNDTLAVTGNYNFKNDSIFKRGTLVTSINNIPNKLLIKYMLEFLPEDGYANNVSLVRLSANFPYFHRNIFGLTKTYTVGYIDSVGQEKKAVLPLFIPKKDSTKKDSLPIVKLPKITSAQKLLRVRNLQIDSTNTYATLTLNSFAEGRLRTFFRKSFRTLKKENIKNLIIDVRNNGGGRVGMSTLLTKYISRKKFLVADSIYSITRTVAPFGKYIKGGFLNTIEMLFISKKNKANQYHIRYLENKVYSPKSNNYKGNVIVLISGPTFSASTVFCNAIKGQQGITLLGEETGGGWYGNNGIIIPDVTLPNTKVRVRLPLYKLVQYNHSEANKGLGIVPDVLVPTSYDALLQFEDKKMQVAQQIIANSKN